VILIGLVHGVGLSTRLQELPSQQGNLLLQIISFNVGVEIGQIVALVVMLVVLKILKSIFEVKPFLLISQMTIMSLGVLLFLMQMHGYLHTTSADEFGFSQDNHVHDHIRINKERAKQRINRMQEKIKNTNINDKDHGHRH